MMEHNESALSMTAMSFDPEISERLDQEKILRAMAMSPEEKLLAGLRLFDRSCRIMTDGIRDQFPDADEASVQRILLERLTLIRRLESGE